MPHGHLWVVVQVGRLANLAYVAQPRGALP